MKFYTISDLKFLISNKNKNIFDEDFFQSDKLNKEDHLSIINCIQDYYNSLEFEDKSKFCKNVFIFCKDSVFSKDLKKMILEYVLKESVVGDKSKIFSNEFINLILPYEYIYDYYSIFFIEYLQSLSREELNKIVDIKIKEESIFVRESTKILEEKLRNILEKEKNKSFGISEELLQKVEVI